jgi:hypothetical protein
MARGHANLRNQIRPSKQQLATSKIGSGAQLALVAGMFNRLGRGNPSPAEKRGEKHAVTPGVCRGFFSEKQNFLSAISEAKRTYFPLKPANPDSPDSSG